ncbi:MAG TPA: glycosyltransferase family 4 protein [Vicinamibacterales bacterium]|nr:glycosyltransferase family 4 protein [Vicinamibacterales bacterium]
MMRALVIAPCFHGADGVSAVSRQIVHALTRCGVSVSCLALDDHNGRSLVSDPLEVPVATAGGGRARFAMRTTATSVAGRFDRIIVTHLQLAPAAWVAHRLARDVAVYLHGVEVWRPLNRRACAFLASTRLLANSHYTVNRFREWHPSLSATRVSVCAPATPPRVTATRPFDARSQSAVIVGRLWSEERYKGHDALLDVWPSHLRHHPHARLVIVGDGDDRVRLQHRVQAEGLSASVVFRGRVSRSELEQVLDDSRVFVMPSSGEGFGIVYLEAMHAGRPCIGSPGAASEVIEDGKTGLLVPVTDRAALVDALDALYTDDARAAAMGAAGLARARGMFGLDRMSRELGAALDLPC